MNGYNNNNDKIMIINIIKIIIKIANTVTKSIANELLK